MKTHYSKSSLKAECRYGYVNGWSSSINSMMGSVRHLAIDRNLSGYTIGISEVENICHVEGVPKMFADDIKGELDSWQVEIGNRLAATKTTVSIESREEKTFKHGKPILRVDTGRWWSLNGMLDYLCADNRTGDLEVYDWKSGAIPKSDRFEHLINGVMVLLSYGVEKVTSYIYAIIPAYSTKLVLERKYLESYLDDIERVVVKIESEDKNNLQKTVNGYCSWCGLANECDKYLEMLSGTPVFKEADSITESLEEIDRLGVIKKAVESEQKKLKERWFGKLIEDGDVIIDGHRYFVKPGNSTNIPAKAVYNTLKDFGFVKLGKMKLDDILVVRSKELNQYLGELRAEKGDRIWKVVSKEVNLLKTKTPTRGSIKKELLVSKPPQK